MHTKGTRDIWPKAKWIEGFLLLAGAPFLLFPEQYIIGTTAALIVIILLWLWPILFLRTPLIPPTPFNLVFLLFMFMVMVGILVTADPQHTLPKACGIILGISTWRFIVITIDRPSLLTWAIAGFILLGVAMTLFGLLNADWLLKSSSQVPFLQGLERINLRDAIPLFSAGSGIHPNQIAGSIMLYLPLMLSLLFGFQVVHRNRWILLGTIILILLATSTLVLTQSRSGWLGMAGGFFMLLILWALFLPPSRMRKMLWVVTIIIIILGSILFVQLGGTALIDVWLDPPQETVIGSLATLNFRQEIWPWALAAVRDFPFTGTGLGAFRDVARRLYPIQVVETFDFAHAHNVFLQMTLDLGIPGLVSYVAMLIISFTIGWQISRKSSAIRPVSIGLMAGLIAFHMYGLTDAIAIGAKPSLLLWVLVALLSAANRISVVQRKPRTRRDV